MKIRKIKWDIDIDDVLKTIDEMTVEEATKVLGFPKDTYTNINTLERDVYDMFERSPEAKANLLGLPSEANIPDDTKEIADYLSDEYEFCVISFEIEPDFNKAYIVEGAKNTGVEGLTFAVCSTKDRAELAKKKLFDGECEDELTVYEVDVDTVTINDVKVSLVKKPMTDEEIHKMINSLSSYEQDRIYRYLWSQYVRKDVISHAESIGIELDDGAVDMIVDRYVEQGDYDCNLNYWANIENLIEEEGGNKNEN